MLPYYPPFTEPMAQHCLQAGSRENGERNLSPIFIETSHSWQDGGLLGLYGTSCSLFQVFQLLASTRIPPVHATAQEMEV